MNQTGWTAPRLQLEASSAATAMPTPTQTPSNQGNPMAMGLVFVPALLILLVLLLVVAIRITPWISWKLSKPQVSWAEGVEIAYPLDPLEASELQGPCGTEFLKSHKSSEQLIVQLDPSHRGISCPVLRSNQSDAVITVGVPPSYPNAPENIE